MADNKWIILYANISKVSLTESPKLSEYYGHAHQIESLAMIKAGRDSVSED